MKKADLELLVGLSVAVLNCDFIFCFVFHPIYYKHRYVEKLSSPETEREKCVKTFHIVHVEKNPVYHNVVYYDDCQQDANPDR